MSALTLEQFRATGRDVESLGDNGGLADMGLVGVAGRLYADCFYIERADGHGAKWCLTIGNDGWLSDDLADLEHKLYEWALAEGGVPEAPIPLYWRGLFGCLYERQAGPDAKGWMTLRRLNDGAIREFNAAGLVPLTDADVIAQMKAAIDATEVQS